MASKKKNPLDNCENLIEIDAPGFIQEFHNNAVGSISAMAGAFSGLATALQSQNNRSEEIEHRIVETNDSLRVFGEKMEEAERIVTDLASRIEEQLSNINERFEKHSEEFEQKLDEQNQELRGVIDDTANKVKKEMKKDCKKMISKIASSVKNTENQIKSLNKACQDNQDKMEITKQKVEEVKQKMKDLSEKTKQGILELNEYVEKTTTDLKEYVEHTTKKMSDTVQDLDKRFQEFRFKTDNDLAHKADIEDLKRKMDVSEFLEFSQKHKEAMEDQVEVNEKLNEQIVKETKDRVEQQNTYESSFAIAETDRRQIREELDYIKSRIGDVPDPGEEIENLRKNLMDHISQVEAMLREEMKARMAAQSVPNPSFGSKDGTCFSCGKGGPATPSSGAFPAMKSRSPKNVTGGGFKSPTKKKIRTSQSFANATSSNKNMQPKRLQGSKSLPYIPGTTETIPMTPTDAMGKENNQSDPLKLPSVDVALGGYTGVAKSPNSSELEKSSAEPEKSQLPPAINTDITQSEA